MAKLSPKTIPSIVIKKVFITEKEALSLLLVNGISYERALFMCEDSNEREEVYERYKRLCQRPYP